MELPLAYLCKIPNTHTQTSMIPTPIQKWKMETKESLSLYHSHYYEVCYLESYDNNFQERNREDING